MTDAAPPRTSAPLALDRAARLLGPLGIVAVMVGLAGRTGSGAPTAAFDLAAAGLTSVPLASAWIAAAFGFGRPLRHWLTPRAADAPWIQLGLGIAALLVLDAALGRLGLLQAGRGIGAWFVLLAGVALAGDQIIRSWGRRHGPVSLPWLAWTAAPAVAVLLVASCTPPGWLWSSEFGGYDALSYHLQLPAEWLARGRAAGLEHNVYSFLPSYVECAYLHLATIRGDAVRAAIACQLLHAGLAIIAAALIGRVAFRLGGRTAGGVAFVLALATPWTIVAGSLAYNEMAVAGLLAAGLLLCIDEHVSPGRRGIALGLIIAAACGAKLTAAGFVAAPLLVLHLWTSPRRTWARSLAGLAAAAVLAGSPYLINNLAETGNPLFPFATGILGRGHWTPEQAAIWRSAHGGGTGSGSRFVEGWNQLGRYGIGPNPDTTEPWRPQWSILPWLALAGLVLSCAKPAGRTWTLRLAIVLLVQVIFWLAMTHVKSRFMLPGLAPMAVLAGLGAAALLDRRLRRATPSHPAFGRVIGAILLIAYAGVAPMIYLAEGRSAPAGMIGRADLLTGDSMIADERREWGTTVAPSIAVNHLVPPGARVLLIGEAAPLYYDLDRITYQTTWDRGPLSDQMLAHDGDMPASLAALRGAGYTHVLVNFDMLRRWERSGWNDPAISADVLERALDDLATPIIDYRRTGPDTTHATRWAALYEL